MLARSCYPPFLLLLLIFTSFLVANDFKLYSKQEVIPVERYDADLLLEQIQTRLKHSKEKAQLETEEERELRHILSQAIEKKLWRVPIYLLFRLGNLMLDKGDKQQGFRLLRKSFYFWEKFFQSNPALAKGKQKKIAAIFIEMLEKTVARPGIPRQKIHHWLLSLQELQKKSQFWGWFRERILFHLLKVKLELIQEQQHSHKKLQMMEKAWEILGRYLYYYPKGQATDQVRSWKNSLQQKLSQFATQHSETFYQQQDLTSGKLATQALEILTDKHWSAQEKQLYLQLQQKVSQWQQSSLFYRALLWTIVFALLISGVLFFAWRYTHHKQPPSLAAYEPIGLLFSKWQLSLPEIFVVFFTLQAGVSVLWSFLNQTLYPPIDPAHHPLLFPFASWLNQFAAQRDIVTFFEDRAGRLNYLLISPLSCTFIYRFYGAIEKHYQLILSGKIYRDIQNEHDQATLGKFRQSFVSPIYILLSFIIALAVCHIVALGKVNIWNSLLEGGLGVYTRYFHSVITYYVFALFAFRVLIFLKFIFSLRQHQLCIHPWHRDGSAGMASFGQVSLAANFILCLIGLFLAINIGRAAGMEYNSPLTWFYLLAYIVISPLIFFYPSLSVHRKMRETRDAELKKLQKKMERLYQEVKQIMREDASTPHQETEKIQQLNHTTTLYQQTANMPVWPFDLQVMFQFASSYLLPVVVVAVKYFFSEELDKLGIF